MFRRLVSENKDIVLLEKEKVRDHIFVDDIAKLLIEILCFKTIGIINAVSGEVKTFKNCYFNKRILYKDIISLKLRELDQFLIMVTTFDNSRLSIIFKTLNSHH